MLRRCNAANSVSDIHDITEHMIIIFGLGADFPWVRLPWGNFYVWSRSRCLLFPLVAPFLVETSDASRDGSLKDYPIMLFLRPHYS